MNLKVWWVVAWDRYYPLASLGNVYATFVSKEEAMLCADKIAQPLDDDFTVKVINVSRMIGLNTNEMEE